MLLALAILGVSVLVIWYVSPKQTSPTEVTAPQTRTRPPFTPEVQAALAKSRGFSVLISYTDNGFEPTQATVKKGDAIRFTNNSSHDLWVAAQGTSGNPVYPGASDCGASSFDSCDTLQPGEFWEFTFSKTGTWTFVNNLDKGNTGAVQVVAN